MGMRMYCCECWTINYDALKELCGPEVAAVEAAVTERDDYCGWYRLAADDADDALAFAGAALQKRFREATGGLSLEFLTYDPDMDGTYGREVDEWEGVIFQVNGVMEFTLAGLAMRDRLRHSTWIEAG